MRFVFNFESPVIRAIFTGDRHMKNNEFCGIMPTNEICVNPSQKRPIDDDKCVDPESKAMLQNIDTSYPAGAAHNGSPPNLSSPSSNYDICRICHCEAEIDAPLIAPCYCAGSLLYVHQSCLQQWIKSSDTRKCELCKFEFVMQTKIKPFLKWETLDISSVEKRKILCSVTFHIVAITCVVWSLYVLIDRTAEEVRNGVLEWPFWTKLIVVAIGFTGGLVFMYVQCKMYFHLLRRWRAFNRIIYIQNAPTKAQLSEDSNNTIGNSYSNCPVQVFDSNVNSFIKLEPMLTSTTSTTMTTTTVVTCIEMNPPRFVLPEVKVVPNDTVSTLAANHTTTSTSVSPVPPPSATIHIRHQSSDHHGQQIFNNSLNNNININNNNNNLNGDDSSNTAGEIMETDLSRPNSHHQQQTDKIS